MTRLYIVLEQTLAMVDQHDGAWKAEMQLAGHHAQCVAVDPLRPESVYCGTFGEGLWRSRDAGASWEPVGEGVIQKQVMAVAVSKTERREGVGVVYAGTEPSALYRSEDGGESWREMERVHQLPSAPTWGLPDRPYISHIRWITPDPLVEGRLFVAVEAGALLRSLDGGEHWEDRKPDGPLDTHTLAMHKLAPNRLYSAAGDGFLQAGKGFFQSDNWGDTWYRPVEGLKHHYLWSVAVDPADPDTLVVSAAHGPDQAHDPMSAESAVYRRSHRSSWQQVRAGLPEEKGLLISVLAANQAEAGVFYAGSNKGIFRSADAGMSWEELSIRWPDNFQMGRVNALAVVEE